MTETSEDTAVRSFALRAGALLGVFAALLGLLLACMRPWYLHWGALPEERSGALPGDEHAPGPPNDTRAIFIDAPAERVFSWVAQLGQDRGGFYSYELLEDLAGCEMPDVRQLDPALQHWSVGDKLWMYPADQLAGRGHATLLFHEPGRALVFGTHKPFDAPGAAPTGTWSFVVTPDGPSSSRLITRGSGGAMPSLLGTAFMGTIFEPLHFAMERRMLEGIKALAEGRDISRTTDALQLASWLFSFALFLAAGALVLLGAHWQRRLLTFAASGLTFQMVTLVQPHPLVGVGLILGLCALIWSPSVERITEPGKLSEEAS